MEGNTNENVKKYESKFINKYVANAFKNDFIHDIDEDDWRKPNYSGNGLLSDKEQEEYLKRLDQIENGEITKGLSYNEAYLNDRHCIAKYQDNVDSILMCIPVGQMGKAIKEKQSVCIEMTTNTCQLGADFVGPNKTGIPRNIAVRLQVAETFRILIKQIAIVIVGLEDEGEKSINVGGYEITLDELKIFFEEFKTQSENLVKFIDSLKKSNVTNGKNKKSDLLYHFYNSGCSSIYLNYSGAGDADPFNTVEGEDVDLVRLFCKGTSHDIKTKNRSCKKFYSEVRPRNLYTWIGHTYQEDDELEKVHAGMLKIYEDNGIELSEEEKEYLKKGLNSGKGMHYRVTYMLQSLMHSLAFENLNLDAEKRDKMIGNFLNLKSEIVEKKFKPTLIFRDGDKISFECALAEHMIKRITGKNKLEEQEKEIAKNIGLKMDSLAAAYTVTQIPQNFFSLTGRKMGDGFFGGGTILYLPMRDFLQHQYDYYKSEGKSKPCLKELPKVIEFLSKFEGNFWDLPIEDGKYGVDENYVDVEPQDVKPGYKKIPQFLNQPASFSNEQAEQDFFKNTKANVKNYKKSTTFSPVTADDIIVSYFKKKRIKEKNVNLNNVEIGALESYLNSGLKFDNGKIDDITIENLKKIKEKSHDVYKKLCSGNYVKHLFDEAATQLDKDCSVSEALIERIAIMPSSGFTEDSSKRLNFFIDLFKNELKLVFLTSDDRCNLVNKLKGFISPDLVKSLASGDGNILSKLIVNCFDCFTETSLSAVKPEVLSKDAVDTILARKIDVILNSIAKKNDNSVGMKSLLEDLLTKTTNVNLASETLAKIKGAEIENIDLTKLNPEVFGALSDEDMKIVISYTLKHKSKLSNKLIKKIKVGVFKCIDDDEITQFIEKYCKELSDEQLLCEAIISNDSARNYLLNKYNYSEISTDIAKQIIAFSNNVNTEASLNALLNSENGKECVKYIFQRPMAFKSLFPDILKKLASYDDNKNLVSCLKIDDFIKSDSATLNELVKSFNEYLNQNEVKNIDLSKIDVKYIGSFLEKHWKYLSESQISVLFKRKTILPKFIAAYSSISKEQEKMIKEKEKEEEKGENEICKKIDNKIGELKKLFEEKLMPVTLDVYKLRSTDENKANFIDEMLKTSDKGFDERFDIYGSVFSRIEEILEVAKLKFNGDKLKRFENYKKNLIKLNRLLGLDNIPDDDKYDYKTFKNSINDIEKIKARKDLSEEKRKKDIKETEDRIKAFDTSYGEMMNVVSVCKQIIVDDYNFAKKAEITGEVDDNNSRKIFNYINTNIEEIREKAKKLFGDNSGELKTLEDFEDTFYEYKGRMGIFFTNNISDALDDKIKELRSKYESVVLKAEKESFDEKWMKSFEKFSASEFVGNKIIDSKTSEFFSLLAEKGYLTDEQILDWRLLIEEGNYIPDFILRNLTIISKTNKKDELMQHFKNLNLKDESLDLCKLTGRQAYNKSEKIDSDKAIEELSNIDFRFFNKPNGLVIDSKNQFTLNKDTNEYTEKYKIASCLFVLKSIEKEYRKKWEKEILAGDENASPENNAKVKNLIEGGMRTIFSKIREITEQMEWDHCKSKPDGIKDIKNVKEIKEKYDGGVLNGPGKMFYEEFIAKVDNSVISLLSYLHRTYKPLAIPKFYNSILNHLETEIGKLCEERIKKLSPESDTNEFFDFLSNSNVKLNTSVKLDLRRKTVPVISKKNLDSILDLYKGKHTWLNNGKNNFEFFVISIENCMSDIDKSCIESIVSKLGNDFKISGIVAEKLVTGLKDFEAVTPIIDKLAPVKSKKIVCDFLKKLKAYLEKDANIKEAEEHLSSFIDKIDAEALSKDANFNNRPSDIYSLLKKCLDKLKGEDDRLDVNLVKSIIKKLGKTLMKRKVLSSSSFIFYIRTNTIKKSIGAFDLDMYKILIDSNCIDPTTYRCFEKFTENYKDGYTADDETSIKAANYYLDKFTIDILKDLKKSVEDKNGDFTAGFANSELSKVVFDHGREKLFDILSNNIWDEVSDDNLPLLKRFYLYFNRIAEIGVSDNSYKDLIPKMFSELINKVLETKDDEKKECDFFLKLGIFLDIATENKIAIGNKTLKQIVDVICKIDPGSDKKINSYKSVVVNKIKKLSKALSVSDDHFKNQILTEGHKDEFNFGENDEVVLKSGVLNNYMISLQNGIDKCWVKVDEDEIKTRKLAEKRVADNEAIESLLPTPSNLVYKIGDTGAATAQKLFEAFEFDADAYKLEYEIVKNGKTIVEKTNWDSINIPEATDAGKYTVKFYFSGSKIYEDFEKTIDVNVSKADIKAFDNLEVVAAEQEYSKHGIKLLKGNISIIPDGVKVSYKLDEDDYQEITDLNKLLNIEIKSVRTHRLSIKAEGGNFKDFKRDFEVKVNQKKININAYNLEFEDLTFNGKEQPILKSLPELPEKNCKWQYRIGEDDWKDCVTGEPKLTNAYDGKIKFKIVGNENYADSDEKEFDIEVKKAKLDSSKIFPSARINLVKDKGGADLELFSRPSEKINDIEIEYRVIDEEHPYENDDKGWKKYGSDAADLKKAEIGTYSFQFRATDKNNNYEKLVSERIDVQIKDYIKKLESINDLLFTAKGTENLVFNGEKFDLFNNPAKNLPDNKCGLEYKIIYTDRKGSESSTQWFSFVKNGDIEIKDAGEYKILQRIVSTGEYESYEQKKDDHGIIEIKIKEAGIDEKKISSVVNKQFEFSGKNRCLFNASINELFNAGYKLQYKTGSDGAWFSIDKDNLPALKDANKYNIYLKAIGDKNHEDSAEIPIEVNVTRKQLNWNDYYPTIVDGLEYSSESQKLFNEPKKTLPDDLRLMYRFGKKSQWLAWNSNDIPSAINANSYEYEFKIEETDGKNNYLLPTDRSVTAEISEKKFKAEDFIELNENLKYTGVSQRPFKVKTKFLPKGKKLLWSVDGETWNDWADKKNLPTVTEVKKYGFWFKIDDDENYKGFSTKYNVQVKKAEIAEPDEIKEYFPTNPGHHIYNDEELILFDPPETTLKPGTKLLWKPKGAKDSEYKEYNWFSTPPQVPTAKDIGEYHFSFKLDGGKNYEDSDVVTYEIKIAAAQLKDFVDSGDLLWPKLDGDNENGFKFANPVKALKDPKGQHLQFAISDKNQTDNLDWKDYDFENPLEIKDLGTHYVHFRINGGLTHKNSEIRTEKIVVNKPQLNISIVLPKAAPNLEFDGGEQSLFEDAGEDLINFIKSLEARGCKLKYRFGTEDANVWKDYDVNNPPKPKEAGKYTVYFMIDGGENYEDKDAGSIEIKIKTKENTEPPKLKKEDIKWPSAAENLEADDEEHPLLVHDESFELPEGYSWKYSFDNGDWKNDMPTAKYVGKYSIRVAVYDGKNFIERKESIEVEIKEKEIETPKKKEIESNEVVWPKASENLVANGVFQKLIDCSGAKCPDGCKFMYSFFQDGSWFEGIPTGDVAKKYVIYCKVVGDGYEPLVKSEPIEIEIEIKQEVDPINTEPENELKITSITVDKIELKLNDKNESNNKPILLDIIKINIGEKEILVDSFTHGLVNSEGKFIDENGNETDDIKTFKDIYGEMFENLELSEDETDANNEIIKSMVNESSFEKFNKYIKVECKYSGVDISKSKPDKIVDILRESFGENTEAIADAYVENVKSFIENNKTKYDFYTNGELNLNKVGEAVCKEFSLNTSTKAIGITSAVAGIMAATGLTADAVLGLGFLALGPVALPLALTGSGVVFISGILTMVIRCIINYSKEKNTFGVPVDGKGNILKHNEKGKDVRTVNVFKTINQNKKPKQTQNCKGQDSKDEKQKHGKNNDEHN